MEIDEIIKGIKLYKVDSSNVSYIGYNNEARAASVIFSNNNQYIYFDVPEEIWISLCNSESKGKAITTLLKGKYKYVKIR